MTRKADYLLRLGQFPEQEVSWCRLSEGATDDVVVHKGTLQQASSVVKGSRVVALAPACDVLLQRVSLPIRNRKRLYAAIPYALEDSVIAPLDEMHFAMGGGVNSSDGVLVAALSHRKIRQWLAQLKAVDIRPMMLVPEQFCFSVSHQEQGLICLEQEQSYLLFAGGEWGWPIHPENLNEMVQSLPVAGKPFLVQQMEGASSSWLSGFEFKQESVVINDLLVIMAANWQQSNGDLVNLLQGEYSPGERWRQLLLQWRGVAILTATMMMMMMVSTWSQVVKLEEEHEGYRKQLESLYRQAFPEAKRVVNPRLQMERKLSDIYRSDKGIKEGFFVLLEKISRVLKSELLSKGGRVQFIDFKNGVFDLSLEVKSLQDLDRLKEGMAAETRYSVEIVNASSIGGKIEGRMKIFNDRIGEFKR